MGLSIPVGALVRGVGLDNVDLGVMRDIPGHEDTCWETVNREIANTCMTRKLGWLMWNVDSGPDVAD
jgi:hypothetical protein